MENLAFFFREDHQRSQIKGTREAHQEIIWEQFKGVHILILSTASSLNFCYKTSHQNLQGWGHIVFECRSPLCPHLSGKAIKLFSSTSPKTLSLRFNSATQRPSFWHQKYDLSKFKGTSLSWLGTCPYLKRDWTGISPFPYLFLFNTCKQMKDEHKVADAVLDYLKILQSISSRCLCIQDHHVCINIWRLTSASGPPLASCVTLCK